MNWRTLAGLIAVGISLLFLGAFARGADWAAIWGEVRRADPTLVLVALLLNFATYLIRARRWQVLLAPLAAVPFGRLAAFTLIGFGGNVFLPARAGEIVRVVLVWEARLSFSRVLATLVIERILDLICLLSMLALLVAGGGGGGDGSLNLVNIGGAFLSVTVIVGGALLLLVLRPDFCLRVVRWLLTPAPEALRARIVDLVDSFVGGLQALKSPAAVLWLLLYSVAVWSIMACHCQLLARALGIEIGFQGGALAVVMTGFASALPQAPGFLGTFHVAAEAVLRHCGAATNLAKGYAVVAWFVASIPTALLGMACAAREGLSPQEMNTLAQDAAAEPATDAPAEAP